MSEEENEEDGETQNVKSKKKKVYWPAISYWIAMESMDGLHVSTVPVPYVLLATGMEVTAKSLPDCKKRKEGGCSSSIVYSSKRLKQLFLAKKS